MDTTVDYKALYLKKFFQWQDICHRQSIKIEELKKELESARWYQTVQNEDISKLRGLLRECLAHLSLGEIGTSVTPLNILLTRINAALGESEE